MKYKVVAMSLMCALGAHGAFAESTPSDDTNKSADSQAQKTGVDNVQSIDLLFDTDSADLKADADAQLKTLADWANCNAKGALILEGHADRRGAQAYNMELSAKRAAAVRDKLASMGVRSDRIVISVYGKNGPSKGTLQADRRVTIRPAETPVEAAELQPEQVQKAAPAEKTPPAEENKGT